MSGEPFRFVHAADFHLEQPLYGLAEAPDHLRDLLLDAPYAAARRVFETAVLEEADFLALSGDILDPRRTDPYAMAFLLEQFELLQEHDIAVYWAGGRADPPDRWPESVRLPDNVHVFAVGEGNALTHYRDDRPLAAIWGRSCDGGKRIRAANFRAVGAEDYTVVVTYGPADANLLDQQRVDYWALGGRHRRSSFDAQQRVAHYPGSPQGRCPKDTGPHGCTLAHVSPRGRVRAQRIATDVVRWRNERITLADNATRQELERLLNDRAEQIAIEETQRCLLVTWSVAGGGRLGGQLRHGGLADELLRQLRSQWGRRSPAAWTVSLVHEPPESWPSQWSQEDTILGDFLRSVSEHQRDDQPLDLRRCLDSHELADSLAPAAEIRDAKTRARVLGMAAILGVDLLRGDEAA